MLGREGKCPESWKRRECRHIYACTREVINPIVAMGGKSWKLDETGNRMASNCALLDEDWLAATEFEYCSKLYKVGTFFSV